jgi:hypothetical protein
MGIVPIADYKKNAGASFKNRKKYVNHEGAKSTKIHEEFSYYIFFVSFVSALAASCLRGSNVFYPSLTLKMLFVSPLCAASAAWCLCVSVSFFFVSFVSAQRLRVFVFPMFFVTLPTQLHPLIYLR